VRRRGQADDQDRPPHAVHPCTNQIGSTQTAQISMVILRAALGVRPALIRREDSQPPAMLPRSEIR
jgi:hypothetical protein